MGDAAVVEIVVAVVGVLALLGGIVAFLLNRVRDGDVKLHDRMDRLRDESMTRQDVIRAFDDVKRSLHDGIIGVNSRMDALTAAVIVHSKSREDPK